MRDDFLGAEWSAHHRRFSIGIHKLTGAVWRALVALNHQQFDAPWRECRKRTRFSGLR